MMGRLSHLSWSFLLLSSFLPLSNGAVIVAKQSHNTTSDVPGVCRAVISPFDYSAKTRQDYELPVCSVEDSHLIARGNSDVPPLISDVEPVVGQTSANFLFGRQVVGGEDYSCGPDRPCKNGACCPKKTLQCNYGEEYCGTSGVSPNDKCWSNCDAKAECGRNAKVPGQKCPLNVCCGKWGFCGMTKDFCEVEDKGTTGGCQSNCDQPKPKNGASEQLDRVIGYYEAWRHNSSCQDMSMDQIPVTSLTHLYFSFAFITPNDYNIIGMDGLPNELFSQFTDLKKKNPALKVIIAVGGWTHNDPGPLQKVFSNMVSTKANRTKFITNLMAFLRRYAFDGVDFDWEYPGADDRGGVPEDGVNFTQFLKELDAENNKQPKKYIVSYTAPTSFWYMRHFDLKSVNHVDFINVMSYDLHGVWDRDNPIGAKIYGHTNLTEMSLAFDLFWRNDVPANKLNMGLGFYGRAFQLADPACSKPGCLFKGGATKGACSGESGILSYREIQEIVKTKKLTPVHDKEAGVKYITWNTDQWVSFDDKETFAQKKELAKKLGLGGFLIWAIDQDDDNLSALRAVLDPKPVGDFFRLGDKADENWTGTNELCYVSACGDNTCKPGFIFITDQKCDKNKKSQLCCPLSGAPSECRWRSKGPWCEGRCEDDEVMTHMSKYGGGETCSDGQMAHCCKSPLGQENTCYWGGVGQQCKKGDLPLTFSGTVLDILDDIAKVILLVVGRPFPLVSLTGRVLIEVLERLNLDTKKLYCCPEEDLERWKNCNWYGKPGNCFDGHCPDMKFVQLTDSYFGGGETCGWHDRRRTFCCESAKDPLFLPVPLDRLFPHPPKGDSIDTDFTLEIDKSSVDDDDNPNEAAFQFVILASPDELQVSLDKRDGSHWEVFGCDGTTAEKEHTVNIVCTDFTPESTCGKISLGHGVPGTILQMPRGCGPGKYAVAKTMYPAQGDHGVLLPRHLKHLRALKPVVYELTFDYNFARVPTDMGTTQMRVDFSNQDEYWNTVVNGSVTRKKRDLGRRTLADVGGNHVRWLEEEFRDDMHLNKIDRRELQERWFGTSILQWLAQLVKPQITREFRHTYDDTVTAKLIDETWSCPAGEGSNVAYKGHLLAQALLNVKVESSFGFTLIVEKLSVPLDLSQSYLTLYNRGEVTGIVTLEAVAKVLYEKHSVILNLPFPGASLRIPGIATLGPQLTVEGSIDASLTMAGIVETKLQIAKWDVRQVVPASNDGEYKPTMIDGSKTNFDQTGNFEGLNKPEFYAGVSLTGDVTTKLSAAAEFGIRFDEDWEVEPAAAGVVGEVSLLTKFATGVSTTGTCPITFGLDVGARLYARAQAPKIFGWSGGEYDLTPTWKKAIIKGGTCPDLGPIPTKRDLEMRDSRYASAVENRSISFSDSSADRQPKSLSKRGGVYGPALSLPAVGEAFCPRAAKGGKSGCTDVLPAWGDGVWDKDAGSLSRRDSHVHKHLSRHAHAHQQHHHDRHIHELDARASTKPIRACGLVKLINYPPEGIIKGKGASAWGWVQPDVCNSFDWGDPMAARAVPSPNAAVSLAFYDSEHILEGQLVGDFFQHMAKKKPRLPDPANQNNQIPFCDYLEKLWDINPVRATQNANLQLDTIMGRGATLTPLEHIAYVYPGTVWNVGEFVSLQRDINSPAKANAWADNDLNDSGWKVDSAPDARSVLKSLRQLIGSRLYHTDTEIKRIFNLQRNRVGDALGALDNDILPNNPPAGMAAWTPMGLKAEWDSFLRARFLVVVSKTERLVDDWLLALNKQWTTDAVQLFYQDKAGDTPAVLAEKAAFRALIADIEATENFWVGMPPWATIFT